MAKQAKNTIRLWYNGDAEDAARPRRKLTVTGCKNELLKGLVNA